jgi:alkylation response protein AidB-like acyl-CoA dehydrogenase
MQLDFTPEQEDLADAAAKVLDREWPRGALRAFVDAAVRLETADWRELWKTFVSLDWPALTIAEEHGGLGLGPVELAVVAEHHGRVLAPGPLLTTLSGFVAALDEMGSPEQKARWLPQVAGGELTATLALGTDLAASTEGDRGIVLDGTARYVLLADEVDALVAVTADRSTAAIVDAGAVTVAPVHSADPTRGLAHVTFGEVAVSADRVLTGGSFERAFEHALVAHSLELVGTCQAIFDTNLDYAKQRIQFGVPIGSFQAVKHKLVNMFVLLERARATGLFAAATLAEDDARRATAAAMAKAAAGDCARLVAQDGIQLLGGIGYTWEHDQHMFVKRAKAAETLFGGAAEHRTRIATHLLA